MQALKSLIVLMLFGVSISAQGTEIVSNSGIARVDLYRYGGYPNLSSASHTYFSRENGGLFRERISGTIENGHYNQSVSPWAAITEVSIFNYGFDPVEHFQKHCASLLDVQSESALRYMIERNAITQKMFDIQMEVNKTLSPDQVAFIYGTNSMKKSEVEKTFGGEIPEFAKPRERNYFDYFAMDLVRDAPPPEQDYNVEGGTLWIISGQTVDHEALKEGRLEMKFVPLPVKGEDPEKLLVHFDVEKGSRNFEVGHASTRATGSLPTMLAEAVLDMYFEVHHTQGTLNKSFVNAHALDRAHTIIYARNYKMPIIKSDLPPGETAFRKPLADFIEEHKPSDFFKEFAILKKASNGKLSETEMMDFYFEARSLSSVILEDGIRLRDLTNRDSLILEKFLQDKGKLNEDEIKALTKEGYQVSRKFLPLWDTDVLAQDRFQGLDMALQKMENYLGYLMSMHAFEVRGLKSGFVKQGIVGAYKWLLTDAAKRGITLPNDINFIIPDEGQLFTELKPLCDKSELVYASSDTYAMGASVFGGGMNLVKRGRNVRAYVFSKEKIEKWANDDHATLALKAGAKNWLDLYRKPLF